MTSTHDKKVSDTSEEVHDRSEVFTGAAYKLFLTVYSGLKSEPGVEEQEALGKAGEIMGAFLTRATDYTPENRMTLDNHGILVFRRDGTLADCHAPIPPAQRASLAPEVSSQAQAMAIRRKI